MFGDFGGMSEGVKKDFHTRPDNYQILTSQKKQMPQSPERENGEIIAIYGHERNASPSYARGIRIPKFCTKIYL